MSNYVFINGQLYNSDVLAHHGVKGMKWGVRRYQNADGSLTAAGKRRARKADRTINYVETLRKNNKNNYDHNQQLAKDMYSKKKPEKLKKAQALNKAEYDTTEVFNNYRIAKQQAKKDARYKDSDAYKKAKAAYSKQRAQEIIYGQSGHLRIEQLKNIGYSEKKAKGKAAAEQMMVGAGLAALSIAYTYATSKY